MNYDPIDVKLIRLIEVCKQTENYKRLATVSLILTGNRVDEIGVKLGIRPRDKDGNEIIFQYMKLINSILKRNLKTILFKEDQIEIIKTCELLFRKYEGNIPMEHITQMYGLYYDLRKLEIPNVNEKLDVEVITQSKEMRTFSFFSGISEQSKKNNKGSQVKQVLLHGFKEQEIQLQKELREEYDEEKFEKLITLKNANVALQQHESGKIVLRERLKDNLIYQRSIPNIFGYMLIGLFLLFFGLGLCVAIQTIYHPKLTVEMSSLTLTGFATGCFFLMLYRQYYKKGGVVRQ